MVVDERQIDQLIQKGGSIALTEKTNGDRIMNLQLRLPKNLVARIDAVRSRKPKEVRQNRHPWIVQAILNELQREEEPASHDQRSSIL